MALIIEELNRAHRVQARYRMDGDRFTLGRAYSNDAILEDIHTDARHAEIRLGEDDHYYLQDLNSTNGSQLLGNLNDRSVKPCTISSHQIASGDLVQCGKSRLRLFYCNDVVPEATPLHSLESLFSSLSRPVAAVLLVLGVAISMLLLSYLGYARTYEWTIAINILASVIVGLVVYAGAWAFVGRVVRHETHFFAHLSIAAIGALSYTVWEWFSGVLNYNFAIGTWMETLDFAVLIIILPSMLWCACYLATNLGRGWRWSVALVLPLGFLGLNLVESISQLNDFSEAPEISTELKYDNMLLRKPVPMQEFIASSPALFDIPIEKDEPNEKASASSGGEGSNTEVEP
ncbi:FHA domain-containing protein [Microbulbifer sp. 2205BS26-8]|uniref:FHA domain-containing protein n=1 Tax=Microbulbifer sp. 2205BS26-8 TaxID=3064386 RepID=UPI00273F21C1|nr:FHA domain-containing protein [Microbulbifer sp. 2205BS26-8]MDP5209811.1 FHA domain-containing protein [Microbulbifer sp. 2205BS26-8]